MSDDDSPDNVLHMPRIGSPPPPPVPPPPALDEGQEPGAGGDSGVRISAFDAPAVPHTPPPPDALPATFRSDGLGDGQGSADAGPPRTGALSLAAILAIALAAFEGLQSWVEESGPRRAQAAAHQRELELLAAKANADATRHRAEAGREHARGRRVPSSHDYGRSALGRGSGGSGRGPGGNGLGRAGTGRSGPYSGLAQHRSPSPGGRQRNGHERNATGKRTPGPGGSSNRNGGGSSRTGTRPDRSGDGSRRNSPVRPRSGDGSRRNGGFGPFGGSSTRGPGGAGGGGGKHRSPRRAVADWWGKGRKNPPGAGSGGKGPGGPKGTSGAGAAGTRTALRNAVKNNRPGPTFWEAVGDRMEERWRKRHPAGTSAARRNTNKTRKGDRSGFRDAVFNAVNDRWKKRRERWDADGGPRNHTAGTTTPPKDTPRPGPGPASDSGPASGPGPRHGRGAGQGGPGPHYGPRSSPFDATSSDGEDAGPIKVPPLERLDGGPGSQERRRGPHTAAAASRGLPRQGQPALPRAPQRPAGPRPGTTRRKETRMDRMDGAYAVRAGAMSAQHHTDITLDDVCRALEQLTSQGMDTHDGCEALAKQARRLLGQLELMSQDLSTAHNAGGSRPFIQAVADLQNAVSDLARRAAGMAQAALDAAELAEAEETAMNRDYRPVADATSDAGLHTPSSRLHNEN
ncbi:hypothetical protein [Streptomyces griseoaurantiacus]|uniref:hypothetical protein n=1 Tax=Streptomyces griseoaurantiacus TaxID=68213 RepID=UPI003460A2CE